MKVNGSAPTGAAAPTSRPARDTEGGFAPSGVADSARAAAAGRPSVIVPLSLALVLGVADDCADLSPRR